MSFDDFIKENCEKCDKKKCDRVIIQTQKGIKCVEE